MIFKEKLVVCLSLAHYGMVDGLIDYVRDVAYDEYNEDEEIDERDEDGNLWWHAEVNIGNDEEGNEYPYTVIAHGLIDSNGDATTEKLWLSVDSDFGDHFIVKTGLRILECV